MIELDYGVWMVTRAEWGARKPRSRTSLSANLATDHWEGPHMGWPWDHASCASKVRQIQNFHMDSRGWEDIAYNLLTCGHGFVFEGRGRGVRSAANGTTAGNNGSFAHCYLGGEGDAFTDAAKRAMKAGDNYLTYTGSGRRCHRDWKPTACPGDIICAWTHSGQPISYSPTPPPTTPVYAPEDDDMDLLIKGDASSEYLIKSGATKRHMDDYDEADAYVWGMLVAENRVNADRQSWGLPRVQLIAHGGVAKKEDGKEHFEPIPVPQAFVDQLTEVD